MSDTLTVWQLPDFLPEPERISVESILHHAGGKEIVLRQTTLKDFTVKPDDVMYVEVGLETI